MSYQILIKKSGSTESALFWVAGVAATGAPWPAALSAKAPRDGVPAFCIAVALPPRHRVPRPKIMRTTLAQSPPIQLSTPSVNVAKSNGLITTMPRTAGDLGSPLRPWAIRYLSILFLQNRTTHPSNELLSYERHST